MTVTLKFAKVTNLVLIFVMNIYNNKYIVTCILPLSHPMKHYNFLKNWVNEITKGQSKDLIDKLMTN